MYRSTDAKEGRKILLTEGASLAFRCLEFPVVLYYLVCAFVSVWFQVLYCAIFAGAIYFSFLCVCDSSMWMQILMCVCAFTGWNQLRKLNLAIWTEQREASLPKKHNNKKSSLWVFTHLLGSLYEGVPISVAEKLNRSTFR